MRIEIIQALVKIRLYVGDVLFEDRRMTSTLQEALREMLGTRFVGEVALMLRLYAEGYPHRMFGQGSAAAYWIEKEAQSDATRYYVQEEAVLRAMGAWFFVTMLPADSVVELAKDETGAALAASLARFCRTQPPGVQRSLLGALGRRAEETDADPFETRARLARL